MQKQNALCPGYIYRLQSNIKFNVHRSAGQDVRRFPIGTPCLQVRRNGTFLDSAKKCPLIFFLKLKGIFG
jgi:hypothetical protein